MGRFFSDVVEQALKDIYYDVAARRGQESFKRLEQASAAGDGDATCILARCLCGHQYVWSGHGFLEDDTRAEQMMHKAVEQGSAIGVLLALRSGELSETDRARMPFASLQEAFDIVLKKAEQGEPFCQYTIGNTYFWWDFLEIQGKDRDSFSSIEAFREYLKENIVKCEDWFWKAFKGGIYYGGNNLRQYYEKGDEDLVPPQPEKAAGIWKMGAELGYPTHQYLYAKELEADGRSEEALMWHKKAADSGETDSWFYVGLAYEEGKGVQKDERYAAQCYENGIQENVGCQNRLGVMYFQGKGVVQNYEKSVALLMKAFESGSNWGTVYLAKAYFNGWGVTKDYTRARGFLEKVTWSNPDAYFMLGVIYAQGLGVPEDIKRGVEYLQKSGNHQDSKTELAKYKKTLFGKWVRRK